jgi:two-component system, OmpR family, sensor kinase
MNRHALRLHITLFFLVLMVIINILFVAQYHFIHVELRENGIRNFQRAKMFLHRAKEEGLLPQEASQKLDEYLQIQIRSDCNQSFERMRPVFEMRHNKIFETKEGLYAVDERFSPQHRQVLFYPLKHEILFKILLIALAVNAMVLLFYLYLLRRLHPLAHLKTQIGRFAQGSLDVNTHIDGHDEIADVANEFDRAITTIRGFQESRTLFLRNIMHELATPVAKGKLAAALLEDPKQKERFERFFSRLEYLLGEFAKVERVTSNDAKLSLREYRAIDFVDNAIDLLMIERDTVDIHQEGDLYLEGDFELLSVAIKNLLDNALKYGTTQRPEIIVDTNGISVLSHGEILPSEHFEQAFNRPYESSIKGLGLGLYITNKIAALHGFLLQYHHENGSNRFTILKPIKG